MKLTGEVKFRTTIMGKLVLQVQYFYLSSFYGDIYSFVGWRDAKVNDLRILPDKIEVNRNV